MEDKPIYGKSPLVKFMNAINSIKLNLWARKRLDDRTFKQDFDSYKNHPEVISAIDQIIERFKNKNN
jgi:hypothetical protein